MNVVITGASSGIGRALAFTFARHGHAVLAVARRKERLADLCNELGVRYGASAHYLALDITSPEAPQTLLDEAAGVFGKVHGLINAAGMSPYQKFSEISFHHIHQILALNINAITDLCYVFMPHMLAHGEPSHVVNVSSVGGYAPLPRFSVYSGSKHYVRVFTNELNHEYRRTNIKVSGLYPGGAYTEFLALAGQQLKNFGRVGMFTPEHLAEVAYPSIMRGMRVIVPGTIYQAAVLIGKVLPFPLAIRLTEFVYNQSIKPVPPTYPS